MNRQEKLAIVERLQDSFVGSAASFVVNYQGLTVPQMQSLRKGLRQHGGEFKVAKARLVKLAVNRMGGDDAFIPYLKEQIGVVFAGDEVSSVAKMLHDFAKKNEAFKLVAGRMDHTILTANDVVRIALLPSKAVLLAQVCALLQAPQVGLVRVLNGVSLKLLYALQQVRDQKQNSGAGEQVVN